MLELIISSISVNLLRGIYVDVIFKMLPYFRLLVVIFFEILQITMRVKYPFIILNPHDKLENKEHAQVCLAPL